MALAYTAPTWTDGSGEGISASNLQAISNCIEGLVQGTDKAVHAIAIEGSVITLTYADGTQEAFTAVDLKGITSITKTGTSGNVDTYTILYTDGTTDTFTVTNGQNAPGDGQLTIQQNGTTKGTFTANQSTNANVDLDTDEWVSSTTTVSSGGFSFSGLDDTQGYAYKPFVWVDGNSTNLNPTAQISAISGAGTASMTLTYTTDADEGATVALRIIK